MPRILGAEPRTLGSLSQRQNPPGHIKKAFFPDDVDDVPASESGGLTKPGPFLVGKASQYRNPDSQAGHSMTCLVHDCGTSYPLGDWFEISHGSEPPPKIAPD